jgi:sulfate adenylyltransferase subunit 1
MGIHFFTFAVNKIYLIGYDKNRFDDISIDIKKLVCELHLTDIAIIPISATEGDNITVRSVNMPWYKGNLLLPYLETVNVGGAHPEIGFYMPVQRVCRPDHTFRGLQGQVESGTVSENDTLTALQSGEVAIIKDIYIGDKQVASATGGLVN